MRLILGNVLIIVVLLIGVKGFAAETGTTQKPQFDPWDRMETMIENFEDQYEKDSHGFLQLMIDDPIDYDLLNSKIRDYTKKVEEQSSLVDKYDIQFHSSLTGKVHQLLAKSFSNPKLPFQVRFAKADFSLDVEFSDEVKEQTSLSVNGFGVAAAIRQTFFRSFRGLGAKAFSKISSFFGFGDGKATGFTDSYGFSAYINTDALAVLKTFVEVELVKTSCAQGASSLPVDDLSGEELLNFQKAFNLICGIVKEIDQQETFGGLMTAVAKPVDELNDLMNEVVEAQIEKVLGGAAFLSQALYDVDLKVQSCLQSYSISGEYSIPSLYGLGLPCVPHLKLVSDGAAGAGKFDSSVRLGAEIIEVTFEAHIASELRKKFVGDKIELAVMTYAVAKAIETGTKPEIQSLADRTVNLMEEIKVEIQKELNGDVGTNTVPMDSSDGLR